MKYDVSNILNEPILYNLKVIIPAFLNNNQQNVFHCQRI